MEDPNEHLKHLTEIRSLMEKSSRFLSLSGLSGVFAGIFALVGAAVAYWYMNDYRDGFSYYTMVYSTDSGVFVDDLFLFMLLDAGGVLALSLGVGAFFTWRKARRQGLQIWDKVAWRLTINLAVPLATGGAFCLALIYHGAIGLVAPATLIFYGLALINASKYTFNDIRYLGVSQIILGLVGCVWIGYGLIIWALGFGLLHIIYGAVMYFKYERNPAPKVEA